ncbi:hypothetical protein E8E14_000092 [Neopestalotiopsis sp. 37M]|nr:hypothetical protein E8E14_000092 [Neopestalotiopsis sp. 37M]
MKEIYSGACVTVVAATDKGGLFVPRTCNEDGEEAGGETSQQTRPAYPINAQGLHGSLLATHWASRGWTFQEQLLSKRSINFLDDTIFWDCECSVWWPGSEGIAGDAEEKFGAKRTANPSWDRLCTFQRSEILVSRSEEVKREVEKHETLSRALKSPSVPNFRLYMELICRYNHRSLTYPQDALPAFSGVLRSVTQGSLNSFVCGLPAIFLDAALLWQPLQKAKRRVATGTSRNIAPAAPLPSWSWVGWQCLIDPESMINGLDYEVDQVHNGISVIPQTSWKTTKLVDWYALSNKDHSPGTLLIEHQLMNSCKEFRNNPYAGRLPEGWSRKSVFEFVSTRALVTWQGPELSQSPEYQPIQCFFHGNQDDVLYYYPFPSIDTSSMAASSLSDAAFLSCITSVAHFNIRRILVCEYTGPALIGSLKSIDYSVTRTPIYKDKAELMKYNSVITLEDSQGRWAGLLKVMDDNTAVDSGHTIQLIAISKGRADRREVSRTYEARVDKHGCILNGFRVAHFQSSSNDRSSSENERNKNLNPSPDLGPLNPKDLAHDKYSEWEDEMYSFYNVLWVETKDGVMYRKAAGRISEDIWEQTCGVPQRIVLG